MSTENLYQYFMYLDSISSFVLCNTLLIIGCSLPWYNLSSKRPDVLQAVNFKVCHGQA